MEYHQLIQQGHEGYFMAIERIDQPNFRYACLRFKGKDEEIDRNLTTCEEETYHVVFRRNYGIHEDSDTPPGLCELISALPEELRMLIYSYYCKNKISQKHAQVCPCQIERAVNERVHKMYCKQCVNYKADKIWKDLSGNLLRPISLKNVTQADICLLDRSRKLNSELIHFATLDLEYNTQQPQLFDREHRLRTGLSYRNLEIRREYFARLKAYLHLYFNPKYSFFPYSWEHQHYIEI